MSYCEICDFTFASPMGLTKHLCMHKTNTTIQCKKCGKSFYGITVYKHHRKNGTCVPQREIFQAICLKPNPPPETSLPPPETNPPPPIYHKAIPLYESSLPPRYPNPFPPREVIIIEDDVIPDLNKPPPHPFDLYLEEAVFF